MKELTLYFVCTLKGEFKMHLGQIGKFFNPYKMVKHTQTIRLQFTDEFFEYLWPFCEIGA